MRTTRTIFFALMLSVITLLFTTISAIAAEVPADKYTYTLSDQVGIRSEKIQMEEYDDNQAFRNILSEESNEVILVKDGAQIKFTPKEKMPAKVDYYTVDGAYAGTLFWTIDGSEAAVSEVDANKTAALKLCHRYGGYTCDLYYVLTIGSDKNATQIIYKVTDNAATEPAQPATSAPTATSAQPATAAQPAEKVTAAATASKVLVDGRQVAFEAYNINGSNYFKLRDIAMAVNGTQKSFEVGWDNANKAISLTAGQAYTATGGELAVSSKPTAKQAALSTSKVYLAGQEANLTAYLIEGNNYFKLRDIGEALGITITWDAQTNSIGIDTAAE